MSKPRTLQVEQEHHRKAFELYYAQGGKRSCARLAEAMKISVATAKLWARSFDWRKRIGEREATVARQVADEAISSSQQTQSRNRKLIELATNRLAKAMLNGQIKYQLADLDRLIRLQSFLDAEADRAEQSLEEKIEAFFTYWAALPTDQKRHVIERIRGKANELRRVEQGGTAVQALPVAAPEPPPTASAVADPADPGGIPK